MQELLLKVPDFVQVIALLLMALVILATLIAKLTPTTKDDEFVEGAASKVLKLIAWLPTFGINPKTKKLEEAYQELKAEKAKDEKAA